MHLLTARLARSALVTCVTAVACARAEAPARGGGATARDVVTLHVAGGTLAGPDSVLAGWTTLEHAPGEADAHTFTVFRLPDGVTAAAFVAAHDSARTTPLGAVALGGTDGEGTSAVVHLAPGRVVVTCIVRNERGGRHAASGEWRELHVVPRPPGEVEPLPPQTTIDVEMGDFAFLTDAHWAAGQRFVRARNTGRQDHVLLLARLKDGKRLADAMKDDDAMEPSIGLSRVGPGERAYLPVALTPGRYVLVCLVPDASTGRTHLELGMMREVEVVTLVAAPRS